MADGPRSAKEVKNEARNAGIAERTLWRAKSALGMIAKKTGCGGGWTWELPEGCQIPRSVPIKNNCSLGQPWRASGDEKPPSDYDHDKQREHEARHHVQNFALYNAPPGTWQRMPVYFYLSALRYEADNRLKPGLVTHALAIQMP